MVASNAYCVRNIYVFVILLGCIYSSCCINMGLIAELKRLNPTVIKKSSRNSPVFINTKTEGQHVTGEMVHKLQANPSVMMKSLKLSKRFSRSIWPKLPLVPFLLPLIPKSPVLPLLPNCLPDLVRPALPMGPVGNITPIAKLSHQLGWSRRNAQLHEKLLEMKYRGSLSPLEYHRFKNLLFRY